jgi:methylthioribose-1-phosphate isomerase
MAETIVWKNNQVVMIDQRKLPLQETYVVCKDYRSVIRAIKHLVIRGAPAIGVAAAMGVALGALKIRTKDRDRFDARLDAICREMAAHGRQLDVGRRKDEARGSPSGPSTGERASVAPGGRGKKNPD